MRAAVVALWKVAAVAVKAMSWDDRSMEVPVTSLAASRNQVIGQHPSEKTLLRVIVGGLAITTDKALGVYEALVTAVQLASEAHPAA